MKFAICNETYQGWEWAPTCAAIAKTGYTGVEIAPFTLASDVRQISALKRKEIRLTAESVGLEIVGLHWLLVSPEGLSITSDNPDVRQTTADYLCSLVELTVDLGGKILVLGSPKQRRLPQAASFQESLDTAATRLEQSLKAALEIAGKHGITICLEPLPAPEADFVLTLQEAIDQIMRIGHPSLKSILDVKSASSEVSRISDLILKFSPWIAHVHANDANRRGPGFGETDFTPVFESLKRTQYDGWTSVEVFDYSPDPDTIAKKSLGYMRGIFNTIDKTDSEATQS